MTMTVIRDRSHAPGAGVVPGLGLTIASVPIARDPTRVQDPVPSRGRSRARVLVPTLAKGTPLAIAKGPGLHRVQGLALNLTLAALLVVPMMKTEIAEKIPRKMTKFSIF